MKPPVVQPVDLVLVRHPSGPVMLLTIGARGAMLTPVAARHLARSLTLAAEELERLQADR